jgi:hypothetical protein
LLGQKLYTSEEQLKLCLNKKNAFDDLVIANPLLGADFRASIDVGSISEGQFFNSLDFLEADWNVCVIRTEMAEGALVYVAISYQNDLLVEKGAVSFSARTQLLY